MKIQRIITAEGKSGVATRIDTIDTATVDFLTNIWGFDKVPDLPLRPEQVLGEYKKLGMFGPLGGIRVDLFTLAPEAGEGPSGLARAGSIDMGTPGMVPGKEGEGMHRTDSIDLSIVIDGEPNVGYPGEDGQVHELTLKTGDLVVHNGTFHSWHNRSSKNCTIMIIVLAAERKAAKSTGVDYSGSLRYGPRHIKGRLPDPGTESVCRFIHRRDNALCQR